MSALHIPILVEMVIKFLFSDVLREQCYCGKIFCAQNRVTIYFLYLLNIPRIEYVYSVNIM